MANYLVIALIVVSNFFSSAQSRYSELKKVTNSDSSQFVELLNFDVTSDSSGFVRNLSKSLILHVEKVQHVDVKYFGWEIAVIESGKSIRNLLYHSLQWHGPYPTQIYSRYNKSLFPDIRILQVQGYPYEIKIQLFNCTANEAEGFLSGTVQVSFRKLKLGPVKDSFPVYQ